MFVEALEAAKEVAKVAASYSSRSMFVEALEAAKEVAKVAASYSSRSMFVEALEMALRWLPGSACLA